MYNKISMDSVDAFLNQRPFNRENMTVNGGSNTNDHIWSLMLHGNAIAKMLSDGTIYISTCGWHTRTTLMRLNALLYAIGSTSRIRIKKGEPFLETKHGLLPWGDGLMVRYKMDTRIY
jgi:hypothetical protein